MSQDAAFLVDAMLGSLAKKLRLLGFDAEYARDIAGGQIINMIRGGDRIIITKNARLYDMAGRAGRRCVFLEGDDEPSHVRKIARELGLGRLSIKMKTARCTICNGELYRADADSILDSIPPAVLIARDEFMRCSICRKIYWEGTHIERLQGFVGRINGHII